MAKPMKSLELHYPIIDPVFNNNNYYYYFPLTLGYAAKIKCLIY